MSEFEQVCDFRKKVEHRLVDIGKSKSWLAEEVQNDTGLKVDVAYLGKIWRGERRPTKIIASICKILNIENPNNATLQGKNSA